MNKVILILSLLISFPLFAHKEINMDSKSIGQKYIDFISKKPSSLTEQQYAILFSAQVKKIINSTVICTDRNQLMKQWQDGEKKFGDKEIKLLNIIQGEDPHTVVVNYEMLWTDGTTDTVIAILKVDHNRLIEKINAVFGEKAAYQWQP